MRWRHLLPALLVASALLAPAVAAQTPGGDGSPYALQARHIVFALGVVAALIGFGAWSWFDARERAVEATPKEDTPRLEPGREGFVQVHVRNRSGDPVDVELEVLQAPDGWKVAASRSAIRLGPGTGEDVWVSVTPPEGVPSEAETAFVLGARSTRARFRTEEVRFRPRVDAGG